jgi:hypothetical protein
VNEPGDGALSVGSDLTAAGVYVLSVSCGTDLTFTLDRDHAVRYAMAAIASAEHAEFDAAVLHLLTTSRADGKPGEGLLSMQGAAMFVDTELRPDRPALDVAATEPLEFRPAVTPDGKPFVVLHAAGEPSGQFTPREVRSHATDVLSASVVVDLDAQLWRTLRTSIGLDDRRARRIVGDMLHFRNVASELSEEP